MSAFRLVFCASHAVLDGRKCEESQSFFQSFLVKPYEFGAFFLSTSRELIRAGPDRVTSAVFEAIHDFRSTDRTQAVSQLVYIHRGVQS